MSFKGGAVSEKRAVFIIPVCGQLMCAKILKLTAQQRTGCKADCLTCHSRNNTGIDCVKVLFSEFCSEARLITANTDG